MNDDRDKDQASTHEQLDPETRREKELWDKDHDNSRDSNSRNNDATHDRNTGGRERGR